MPPFRADEPYPENQIIKLFSIALASFNVLIAQVIAECALLHGYAKFQPYDARICPADKEAISNNERTCKADISRSNAPRRG